MNEVVETNSPEETEALGERIGRGLQPGDVVALYGDLGAGKTCLTRGIARGAGSAARVTSPTFILLHEYALDDKPYKLYHLDLYRLGGADELEDIGGGDVLNGTDLAVVEWPERAEELLPDSAIRVEIAVKGETTRSVTIRSEASRVGCPGR